MRIFRTQLTPSYVIILFDSLEPEYGFSSGSLCARGQYVEVEFANEGIRFPSPHSVFKATTMTEEKAAKMFIEAGIDGISTPYINYTDRSAPAQSVSDSWVSFLKANWDRDIEKTWVIIPKPNKQLTGKKIAIEFDVIDKDFFGCIKMDLDVYMTPVTNKSKTVTFSVRIPKHIYDKCMTDADESQRPKRNFIEAEALAYLHSKISKLGNQASDICRIEKNAKQSKKIICINFHSQEVTTRDQLNHAYTGQRISTSFNFYIAYKSTAEGIAPKRIFTYKKYQTGLGSTEKGISGILDTEASSGRNEIIGNPDVIMDWSQEREDFLTKVEEGFRSMSENLNKFLSDLTEDKLQNLIENMHLLKLGN